jgi:hypothetical protein
VDGYGLGHDACRRARLGAPAWQEVASAIRLCLPGLPTSGREACARALLAEAEEISGMTFLPAPCSRRPREEFQRALLAGACRALRRGGQAAAVSQAVDGTWEVADVRMPPACPREPDHVSAEPGRRPALRLVGDERPAAPGACARRAAL